MNFGRKIEVVFQDQWANLCLSFTSDPTDKIRRLLTLNRQEDALRIARQLLEQEANNASITAIAGSVAKTCRNSFLWYGSFRELQELNDANELMGIFNDFHSEFYTSWVQKRRNAEYFRLLELLDLIERNEYSDALHRFHDFSALSKKQWQLLSVKARCYYELGDSRFSDCLLALGRENFLAPELQRLLQDCSDSGITICLLYSIEKTGNQTILHSLLGSEKFFALLVLQHTLNNNIEKAVEHATQCHDWGAMYNQLRTGLLYKKFLFDYHLPKKRKLKVITMVREPVSLELSRYFFLHENIYGRSVTASTEQFFHFLHQELSSPESPITWFDRELKRNFGFDVYQQEFDKQRGYQIYHHENFDILVVKLESVDDVFAAGVEELLGISNLKLVRKNDSSDHKYAAKYNQLKATVRLKPDWLEQLYKTPWVEKFYTAKEISRFIQKWSS